MASFESVNHSSRCCCGAQCWSLRVECQVDVESAQRTSVSMGSSMFLLGSCKSNPMTGLSQSRRSLTAEGRDWDPSLPNQLCPWGSNTVIAIGRHVCEQAALMLANSLLNCPEVTFSSPQKIVLWRNSIEALLLGHTQVPLESLNSRGIGLKNV